MSNTMGKVRCVAALLASAGLILGLLNIAPANADAQMTAIEAVNIRSGPGTSEPIVGGLYRGQTVTAVSSAGGWTTIKFMGHLAYIATTYLTKGGNLPAPSLINAGTIKVATADLNLRRGPGLSFGVIQVIKDGSRLTMTGKTSAGYAEVSYGTARGWASTQYLASSSTGLPGIVGVRVATTSLLIRTTSGEDYQTVAEVPKGTKLMITGATQNGRAQIVYRNAIRWVTARYLANPTPTGPTVPGLPRIIGTRYATTALNIRSNNTSTYTLIAEVPSGTQLSITGVVQNGRAQIVYRSAVRWVTAAYLSTEAPVASPPAPTTGSYAVERGLKPNAVKVHRAAMVAFPQITTYYGVRPDSIPDHPSGRALDLMLPDYQSASGRALGDQVAAWAQANHSLLGIEYIIWNQHIWNVKRSSEGWRYMANRGSDSANHKNHVHITVFG